MTNKPIKQTPPRLIIVMGVSSCGKSSVAKHLADSQQAVFLDADDYHPAGNIDKMSRGEALDDEDRWPWLAHFANTLASQTGSAIGACSALKRAYRDALTEAAGEPILFIHLAGSVELLEQRIAKRENHFMPPSLLASQLATLEAPAADELAISIDISGSKAHVIQRIHTQLNLTIENPS